jgi:hypothetical protein
MLGRFSCAFKDCWGSDNRKEIVVAIWHPEIRNRLRIYRHWERPCLNQKFFALDGAVLGRLAADTWRRCRRVTICGKPKPRRMRYAESLKNLDELDESQNKFQIFSNERIVCISLHCLHCLHLSLGDIRRYSAIRSDHATLPCMKCCQNVNAFWAWHIHWDLPRAWLSSRAQWLCPAQGMVSPGIQKAYKLHSWMKTHSFSYAWLLDELWWTWWTSISISYLELEYLFGFVIFWICWLC